MPADLKEREPMDGFRQLIQGLFGCAVGLHRWRYNSLWDGTQEIALAHCEVCCHARAFWPEPLIAQEGEG